MKRKTDIKPFLTGLLLTLTCLNFVYSSNVIKVNPAQVVAAQNVNVDITIENDSQFVAFQLEIPIPSEFTYVTGSAVLNSSRSNGHQINAILLPGDTLRIFGYSISNTPFLSDTGVIASFQLLAGFNPGNYTLYANNAVIGSSTSQNILTNAINGIITLLAPEINVNTSLIDFGDIPLGDSIDKTFTINNDGNQNLQIQNIFFDNNNFSVIGNTAFTIPSGQNSNITIRFYSNIKGIYLNTVFIASNDPDEDTVSFSLEAVAFAVNELHTGSMFAFSGNTDTLTFTINNMEPFIGFQFDLNLPSPLIYIPNSVVLSSRKANHVVSCDTIPGNKLRVVAYSTSNQSFSGNNGTVVSLGFTVTGIGGNYSLTIENVIIGDTSSLNVVSDYYNGTLQIAAADISCNTSINFADVSIFDTAQINLNISNNGNDTLKIQQITFTDPSFFTSTLLPIEIIQGNSFNLPVSYYNPAEGPHSGTMKIYSNDPDENPFIVNLSANSYIPNKMMLRDTFFCKSATPFIDTIWVEIDVENYENFIAFQFDLEFPGTFKCLTDSTRLTSRAQDHTIQNTLLDTNLVRVFAYSITQSNYTESAGPVARLCFAINVNQTGNYLMKLQNVILGDQQSQNIVYSVEDGYVTIQNSPSVSAGTDISICSGDCSVLTASGGYLYSWSSGSITDTTIVCPASTTTYYVTTTDNYGCSATDDITVTVNPLPTVTLATFADVCANTTAFSLSGGMPTGGTYSGQGVSSGYFYPDSTGIGTHTITYSYTDINSCTNYSTQTITVIPLPAVSFAALSDVCVDANSFALTGGSPSGGSYSGSGISNGIFNPATAGAGTHIITYSFTDTNSCSNYTTQNITVNPLPSISMAVFPDICIDGNSFTLTGGSPTGGTYSGIGVYNGTFYPDSAGTGTHVITYTYTDGNSCTNYTTQTITVNPLPTVTLAAFADVCANTIAFTLTGGLPVSGTYSGQGVNAGLFYADSAGAGTHIITYTYTDSNSCTNHTTQTITVNPLPTVSFTALSDVCVDANSFALTGGNPSAGVYSGTGVSNGIFNPATAGAGIHTITYSFTDTNSCSNYTTQTITVHALPSVSLVVPSDVCIDGNSFTLTGGSPSGGTYSGIGVYNGTFYPDSAGTGTHVITYTYIDTNSCANYATQSISVNPLPTVTLATFADVCANTPAFSLSGGMPIGGNYSGQGVSSGIFYPDSAGVGTHTIIYTYTDSNSCSNFATQTINVKPLPAITLSAFSDVCADASSFTLTGGNPSGGSYSGTGVSNGIFNPAIAGVGTHLVTYSYTDTNSCTNYTTQSLMVNPLPVINLGNDTIICVSQAIVLDAGPGFQSYSWSTGDTTQTILVNSTLGSGLYNVIVTDTNFCAGSDTIQITFDPCTGVSDDNNTHQISVYPVPTNQFLYIKTKDIKAKKIIIINLYGKIVKAYDFQPMIDISEIPVGLYFLEIIDINNAKLDVARIIIL